MSLKPIAELAERLKSDLVDIELETRLRIPPPINFRSDKNITITYYRSLIYPSITFRKSKEYYIQSKELIEKRKIDGINVYLSVEQNYIKGDIKFSLIETNKRKIERQVIQKEPLVEIIKNGYEYMLEIEFDINTYKEVKSIINKYKCPYYPLQKPIEISSVNLARKLSKIDEWGISYKADGYHVVILENEQGEKSILHDNGKIEGDNFIPKNVYEGELMEDKTILYYDCIIYNYKNITNLNYKERRKYIKYNKKDVYIFKYIDQLEDYILSKPNFKFDGFVITNIRNRNLIYKSKFINTVDLKYKNGYLLLENEDISDRIPKDTLYNYVNNRIYEFDTNLNLIKERNDKVIANYKFPYDDNPIYKVVKGIGVPSLRVFHNKIKFDLLKLLKGKILLDIGSGRGGDINKWIKLNFSKVYCVDPKLDLRIKNKDIIEIKKEAKDLPKFVEYDCVSILFVPWDDSFIDILNKSKEGIIAIMNNPKNYECEAFSCKVHKEIELRIPFSETANEVKEKVYDTKEINNKLENNNWTIHKLDYRMDFGTNDEQILSSMYNYYYITR
uniref:Putative mRNA capping-enzyme n=1 Tax=Millerozyma acaciae TaxID=28986 RepID=Q2P9T4_9ASCO|nr:putative mRNA capping-enzyme [Millerozyma acaciae]